MSDQHCALVKSLKLFLEQTSSSRIFLVAGIHTGRPVLTSFFKTAASSGLIPDEDGIIERSVITGVQRAWVEDRGLEDLVERKQWLVVAKLKWSASRLQLNLGTQSRA
jgi:EEF1A N-terminal glycine/lysine methyltransferase